ncbi:MAG: tetratricopeptide repeat protein, partial [Hyphomicrobiales bacterium]
ITLRVVTALDAELVEGEIGRLSKQRPEQLSAWECYLRGMSYLRNASNDDLQKAQHEFLAATEIEPSYGEAWASLAWAYLKEYGFGLSENPDVALQKGFEAAKKGVALAGKSPFTHYSMSTAYVWRGEMDLSLKELEHAIQLNPYFTRAKIAYYNRQELSDPSIGLEAAEEIRKALTLSPREPDRAFYFWAIARINLVAGEFLDALDWADRAVSVRPDDPNMVYRRAICLASLDHVDEAKKALETCDELSPGSIERLRDWRPYDDIERNDKVFLGFQRHRLMGWQ